LTLTLLFLIALAAIVGTLVPQGGATEELSRKLGPGVFSLLNALQIFDLYHSVWFYVLMGLLAANLIACSWARFPSTLKILRKREGAGSFPESGEALPAVELSEGGEDAAKRIESILKKSKFGKTQISENIVYGEKGAFSHFGVYFVHLSVIVIIIGAVMGSLMGFDGYVNIPEGAAVDEIMLKNGKGIQPLGFSIRCDSFKAEFYNTGAPREFRSEITLLKDGAPVLQGPLTVNNPLYFEGVRIFQASYGEEAGEAVLGIRNPSGSRLVTAGRGDSFGLQGSSIQVYVLRVEKDLMRMGPAVKLAIDTPDGEVQLWVFQEIQQIMREHPGILQMAPMFNPALVSPYTFSLEAIKSRQFTGLQVNSDPGLPLVGAGAALMIFGFLVIYLMSRRQIWAKIENIGSGKVRVRVAGKSSRDPVGLEREIKRVIEAVRQGAKQ